jgi:hypothetical protein
MLFTIVLETFIKLLLKFLKTPNAACWDAGEPARIMLVT